MATVDPTEQLFQAIEKGDRAQVSAALNAGADIELDVESDERYGTPLQVAARLGRAGIATLLLDEGAPVDQPNRYGYTALHVAAAHARQAVAELLLNRGASLEAIAEAGADIIEVAGVPAGGPT